MKKLILQPFVYAQEKQLLLFGLGMAFLGCLTQLTRDIRLFSSLTVQNMTVSPTLLQAIADFGISTAALTLSLFILGYFINTKTRLIDIFNTVLIAKIAFSPLLILPLDYGLNVLTNLEKQFKNDPVIWGDYPLIVVQLLLISIIIVLSALFGFYLYQGFKIATHLKKKTHVILFVFLVLIVELYVPSLTTLY